MIVQNESIGCRIVDLLHGLIRRTSRIFYTECSQMYDDNSLACHPDCEGRRLEGGVDREVIEVSLRSCSQSYADKKKYYMDKIRG